MIHPDVWRQRPNAPLAVASVSLFCFVTATATAVAPDYSTFPFEQAIKLEQLDSPSVTVLPSPGLPFVFDERIQAGDTIYAIFRRIGIEDAEALSFLTSDADSKQVMKTLRAGRSVIATVTADRRILSLSLPLGNSTGQFILEREGEQLRKVQRDTIDSASYIEMRSGTIANSLFGATDAAGVPDRIASKFAEIFGTKIDFSRDLRKGDHFSVVYETHLSPKGAPVGTERILAAEFINQGKKHTVVLFQDDDGREAYYTPDGRGQNQAFLRYPLEFTRISSSFGRRFHPIHRKWRNHKGTDFAAPKGTPVMASSDGTIKFVGSQNGYGNTVIINHSGKYSTLYAHMNGFAKGIKNGKRVQQGEVIGYVGMTGWATGPHLHYEVRVNEVQQDPMKIALPAVQPLEARALAAFKRATTPVLAQLALLNYELGDVALAANEQP